MSLVRFDTMSLPTKEEGLQKFKVGDRVELHFFGSDHGERGTVTQVNSDGSPLEFNDQYGNKIRPQDVVCYFPQ